MTPNTLEILPVRGNMPRLLLKTALFLISGCTLTLARHAFTSSFLRLWLLIGGICCILFSLSLMVRVWQNVRLKGPIMTLSPTGIRVALGRHAFSQITWQQLCGFSLKQTRNQEWLLLHVINPEHVIKQVRRPTERLILRLHQQRTGTPFAIPTSVLTYPGDDLTQLLHTWHTRYYSQVAPQSSESNFPQADTPAH